MKHLPDVDIHDEILEIRHYLASEVAAGKCLGRRLAAARLVHLEAEMVRRYEVEMWGAERG